jgi:uncharacterized membrane protein YeaQ/YmgE (transglycosylase-associated protein family)
MSVVIWLFIGALVGILSSRHVAQRRELLRNVVVGAAGALIGGWLAAPYIAPGAAGEVALTLLGIAIAFGAAAVLLFAAMLYREGTIK